MSRWGSHEVKYFFWGKPLSSCAPLWSSPKGSKLDQTVASGKQSRDARGLSLGDAQPPLPPESMISAENPILKTLMYPFVDDFQKKSPFPNKGEDSI